MNHYKGYKEMQCYQKARDLRLFIALLVKTFPTEEKYMLVSQIIRLSRSVSANIAEGYGRYTYTETRNFFIIARGSLTETMEHLTTSYDEKYITQSQLLQGEEICEQVFKLLNGYIAYLDKSKKAQSDKPATQIPNS